jgi:hypothetical protein
LGSEEFLKRKTILTNYFSVTTTQHGKVFGGIGRPGNFLTEDTGHFLAWCLYF